MKCYHFFRLWSQAAIEAEAYSYPKHINVLAVPSSQIPRQRRDYVTTFIHRLPSMLLGSESNVLVLQRRPSPVPSIQMYMAWHWSP